jgi:hypothetical protein
LGPSERRKRTNLLERGRIRRGRILHSESYTYSTGLHLSTSSMVATQRARRSWNASAICAEEADLAPQSPVRFAQEPVPQCLALWGCRSLGRRDDGLHLVRVHAPFRWCRQPSQRSSTFVPLERIRPQRSCLSLQKPRWRRVPRTRPLDTRCIPLRSSWNSHPRRGRHCAEWALLRFHSTTPLPENWWRCSRMRDWRLRCRRSGARR